MDDAWAISFQPDGGVTAEKVGDRKFVIQRPFAVSQNAGWFVDNDDVIV